MRVLITGATGFLGRRVAALLTRKHEVWLLSRSPMSLPNATFIDVELTKLDLRALPAEIDVVVHLAQSPDYREFPAGAPSMFAVNTAATAQLLNYALAAGARQFILASTGAVYEPYNRPLQEDAHCVPESFYAASKLAAEALLAPYGGAFGTAALRLFFLYGSGQTNRLIPNLIDRIRSGQAVVLPKGSDGLVLTPTHVDDVAAVFVAALERRWIGCINVGAAGALSLRAIAEQIGERLGVSPNFDLSSHGPALKIVPSLARLSALYPLDLFRPFSEGLKEMLPG